MKTGEFLYFRYFNLRALLFLFSDNIEISMSPCSKCCILMALCLFQSEFWVAIFIVNETIQNWDLSRPMIWHNLLMQYLFALVTLLEQEKYFKNILIDSLNLIDFEEVIWNFGNSLTLLLQGNLWWQYCSNSESLFLHHFK